MEDGSKQQGYSRWNQKIKNFLASCACNNPNCTNVTTEGVQNIYIVKGPVDIMLLGSVAHT